MADDQPSEFDNQQKEIRDALLSTTRAAGRIAKEDVKFHKSANPEFGAALEEQSKRLLGLASTLLQSAAAFSGVRETKWETVDDVETNWRAGVEVIDSLLEKADIALDRHTGKLKQPPANDSGKSYAVPVLDQQYRTQDMPKPQLLFDRPVDNSGSVVFKPLLTKKPHAKMPFKDSITTLPSSDVYAHPYNTEITKIEYPDHVFKDVEPQPYSPFEETTAIFVNTPELLKAMIKKLKKATEIAIDLEHHDSRSYHGIVSLMQISTRDQDWIVDTLVPWREKLEDLNAVFADPKIVKVLHGAFMDIMWLQRDFGLYIVNMFDTFEASCLLVLREKSLKFLLKKYVDFDASKQYQKADWRIRPLPHEMFDYARSDTHFLLYIYDRLRRDLRKKAKGEPALIREVLERSAVTSLKLYEHEGYDFETGSGGHGWMGYVDSKIFSFTNEQFYVWRALHRLRDQLARELDESLHYIMPRYILSNIANALPTDRAGVFAVAHQGTVLRQNVDRVLETIEQAKKDSLAGPDKKDILRAAREWGLKGDAPAAASPATNGVHSNGTASLLEKSEFWGAALSAEPQSESDAGVSLAIPLPQLTAAVFEDKNAAAKSKQAEAGSLAAHEYRPKEPKPAPVPEAKAEEVLVLKTTAPKKKRRRQDSAGELDASAEPSEEMKELTKAQRREEKKALKAEKEKKKAAKKRKLEANADAAASSEDVDMEDANDESTVAKEEDKDQPIDYSKAASVLHAPKPDKKKAKKTFDPYKKSMDAPSGLRAPKQERGRSGTWKN